MKFLLIGLVLLALAVVIIGGTGEVGRPSPPGGGQPPVGAGIGRERRPHPGGDIGDCLRCHLRPSPPPQERVSFCVQCHPLEASHRAAPTPAHPVRFAAPAGECYLCHSPHYGPEATDHVADEGRASLCIACHLSRDGLSPDEMVEESCAQCHNLGLPEDHPAAAEAEGEGCRGCHGMIR